MKPKRRVNDEQKNIGGLIFSKELIEYVHLASCYTMAEIESNPELAPLKQFAVKVKDL